MLIDTSAAVALVQRSHTLHASARHRLVACTRGFAGHAAVEFLSVMTRLPAPQRVTAATALRLGQANFPASRFVSADAMPHLLAELVGLGLSGGSFYDGLVAAAARDHDLLLVTCDRRAETTYRALGVRYELLRAA